MNKVMTIAERERIILDKLASRIKFLRVSKGMSQQDVINAANISRTTLHNLENGVNVPSLHLLVKMSVAFNIPVHLLIAPTGTFKEYVKNAPITYKEQE